MSPELLLREGYVRAIGAAAVPPGEGRTVSVDGHAVAVFNVGGTFYAIDDACPHQGGPLGEGHAVEECVIACPLHYWEFDLRTGACLTEPDECVRTHDVHVLDDTVFIRILHD
ncbi:MAG: non-heme iron oxygenase ferredoxin subunit [Phycisphaeraceae bacterium]|nr:non-heme iron oxygenase ferredoxin subunit [Phycisphaeraceae bacterium]